MVGLGSSRDFDFSNGSLGILTRGVLGAYPGNQTANKKPYEKGDDVFHRAWKIVWIVAD
jgi:hypothetical protein